MALQQLHIQQFRNISQANLDCAARWNLLVGANGSGKTSVLEAIFVLSHGRSFRTSKIQKVVQHQAGELVVFSQISWGPQAIALGVKRQRSGDWQAKLNGELVTRVADCASVLPVQLLQPESFRLFFGGPKERRQFLDLGLFHVEPEFYVSWLQFNKVLKHRNALLKSRLAARQEYVYWDQQFVTYAIAVHAQRQRYLSLLQQQLQQLVQPIPWLAGLSLELSSGWGHAELNTTELAETLAASFDSDLRFGYSQLGPHKADLRLRVDGEYVDELLSRGQLKVLLFALKIAQHNVIYFSGHKSPILLIDDLASELDDQSKDLVFEFLNQIQSQVFITAIESSQVLPHVPDAAEVALFHVEHGLIKRTDKDGRRK